MNELQELIKSMGLSFEEFKGMNDSRIDAIETALGRAAFGGSSSLGGSVNFSPVAKEHKEKFLAWVRSGADPDGLRNLEIQASLSTLDDTEGGFLTAEEMEKTLNGLPLMPSQ